MRTTDDVAAQLNYNFKPGDRVASVLTSVGSFKTRGIVVAVDEEQHACHVMWTFPDGRTRFTTLANYELRHAEE